MKTEIFQMDLDDAGSFADEALKILNDHITEAEREWLDVHTIHIEDLLKRFGARRGYLVLPEDKTELFAYVPIDAHNALIADNPEAGKEFKAYVAQVNIDWQKKANGSIVKMVSMGEHPLPHARPEVQEADELSEKLWRLGGLAKEVQSQIRALMKSKLFREPVDKPTLN